MDLNFVEYKEAQNLIPLKIEEKDEFYFDLQNIENSWTGRADAMYANQFFHEAAQLIINGIVLFEKGYFDCAFYSLRQSLEISTTIIYFIDNDSEETRKEAIKKWKDQERFPMQNEMFKDLMKRQKDFADLKEKMSDYFEELDTVKQKLNKYVHKQGLEKFYIHRRMARNQSLESEKLAKEFTGYLKKSIGAVAVFRLAIDPFPVLLGDEQIYKRTSEMWTEAYTEDFIDRYIGSKHIEGYKQTDLYRAYYDYFIGNEEMHSVVVDLVKDHFINRDALDEICAQAHLLGYHERGAVTLTLLLGDKVVNVFCIGGFHWYFTGVKSKRIKMGHSSEDFVQLKDGMKYNVQYEEAFLSRAILWNQDFYVEHNDPLSEAELASIEHLESLTKEQYVNAENEIEQMLAECRFDLK